MKTGRPKSKPPIQPGHTYSGRSREHRLVLSVSHREIRYECLEGVRKGLTTGCNPQSFYQWFTREVMPRDSEQ